MGKSYTVQLGARLKTLYGEIGKTHIIYPSVFLVGICISVNELGIIFYIKDIFNATPAQVGNFMAAWSLCYIVGCLVIRPLFNRVLPRYLLIASSFFMSLFVLLVTFTRHFFMAFIYYDLYGVAMAFFWPPIMGWLSQDVEGKMLGKSMSYFNISWSVGLIIGPLLAGILSATSPELPLYAGGALFFLTGLIITAGSLLLPRIRIDRGVSSTEENDTGRADASTILRFSGWVGMFTTFVVIGVVVNIFPVYARDELLLRKEVIGILMQSRTFLSTFVFIILGHATFWHFRITPMTVGQVFLSCIVLAMGFTRSTVALGMLISMIGCLRALSFSSSLFHGISGSINRAGRMAIHESLLAFGLIVGSSLGGMLYQRFSMKAVYAFCFAIVILGALLQLGLYLLLRRGSDNGGT